MSYSFDVQRKAWAILSDQLSPKVRESEMAMRFEYLMEEMHEANHRQRDCINHDARVTNHARQLEGAVRAFEAQQEEKK